MFTRIFTWYRYLARGTNLAPVRALLKSFFPLCAHQGMECCRAPFQVTLSSKSIDFWKMLSRALRSIPAAAPAAARRGMALVPLRSQEDFERVKDSGLPASVTFSADWCPVSAAAGPRETRA